MSAAEETHRLPLFPLENVVLFPHLRVPLHVFEPRYREMTRDALAGANRIGMAVVQPGNERGMGGDPPLFAIGCEGAITQSQQLADGGYNIVLLGLRRFRILDEPSRSSSRLYREAIVESLPDANPGSDAEEIARLRVDVAARIESLARRMAGGSDTRLNTELFDEADDVTFANVLAQSLNFGPIEKQGLLEANSIRERIQHLSDLLEFREAMAEAGGPNGTGTVH